VDGRGGGDEPARAGPGRVWRGFGESQLIAFQRFIHAMKVYRRAQRAITRNDKVNIHLLLIPLPVYDSRYFS
jgi:hypothetical protein